MIPLLLNRSRVSEIDGTARRIQSAYQNTALNSDAKLVQILTSLQSKSILLSEAINRIKAESRQMTFDEARDEKISGLYYLLMGFTHHYDENIKAAALRLLAIFEHYGLEMKSESYTVESSLIHSMLNDYAQPEAQNDVMAIPECSNFLAGLQSVQTEFESIRTSYEEIIAAEGALLNASTLKKEVVAIINKQFIPYLNVMAQLENAFYDAFARTIEEIISENNEVVKRRYNTSEPEPAE